MNLKVLLSSLLCGLFGVTYEQTLVRQFYFVNLNLSWTEAQQYCRKHHFDLATVSNTEEMNLMIYPTWYSGDAWIGLSNTVVTYNNWDFSPPPNPDHCTGIYGNRNWFYYDCNSLHMFFCYSDLGEKTFFPVLIPSTWDDARAYCREHHKDLALIENEIENNLVASMITQITELANRNSWIGWDTKTGWRWSDGSWPEIRFTDWMKWRPLQVNGPICTVQNQNQLWKSVNCDQTLPFFCYKDVLPLKNVFVKMSFSSAVDLSDPVIYNMMTEKIKNITSEKELHIKVIWTSPPKKKTDEF